MAETEKNDAWSGASICVCLRQGVDSCNNEKFVLHTAWGYGDLGRRGGRTVDWGDASRKVHDSLATSSSNNYKVDGDN